MATTELPMTGRHVAGLFIAAIIGLYAPASLACECLWEGSFAEVAPESDLVVLGSIARKKAMPLMSRSMSRLRVLSGSRH